VLYWWCYSIGAQYFLRLKLHQRTATGDEDTKKICSICTSICSSSFASNQIKSESTKKVQSFCAATNDEIPTEQNYQHDTPVPVPAKKQKQPPLSCCHSHALSKGSTRAVMIYHPSTRCNISSRGSIIKALPFAVSKKEKKRKRNLTFCLLTTHHIALTSTAEYSCSQVSHLSRIRIMAMSGNSHVPSVSP
jgi:hypothetical protein